MRKLFLSCWLKLFLLFACSFSIMAHATEQTISSPALASVASEAKVDTPIVDVASPDKPFHLPQLIKNPNIAYILLLIGIYGLFFEFYNPGFILPGVMGGISLILAFYAFQLFPINYVGFVLLLLGIAFMIFEVLISSFGILGVGGIAAFIAGSILLLDINQQGYQIAWSLIAMMTVFTVCFFAILISLAIRASRRKFLNGQEAIVNNIVKVIRKTDKQYIVKLHGESWQAHSDTSLCVGQEVRVARVDGLLLIVEPLMKFNSSVSSANTRGTNDFLK